MDRACASEAQGQRFESSRARHSFPEKVTSEGNRRLKLQLQLCGQALKEPALDSAPGRTQKRLIAAMSDWSRPESPAPRIVAASADCGQTDNKLSGSRHHQT